MNCNKTPKFHYIPLWQRCHKSPGVISSCMSKQDAGIIARWSSNLEQKCFLSFLQNILLLISQIYLKLMERVLSISVRRQWLYISAQKNVMLGGMNYSSQYMITCSVTVQPCKEEIAFIFYFSFYTVDSNSHFNAFTLFSAMHLFKEQQRKLMLIWSRISKICR